MSKNIEEILGKEAAETLEKNIELRVKEEFKKNETWREITTVKYYKAFLLS